MVGRDDILLRLAEMINANTDYKGEINLDTDLKAVGLDSLDVINYLFNIEEAYGIQVPEEDYEDKNLKVMGNMVEYLADRI
jgi:acyl carrier protein